MHSLLNIKNMCELKTIKFSETTMTLKNKIIPIEVWLDISIETPGTIGFTFKKKSKYLGFLILNRVWKDGQGNDYTEASDAAIIRPLTHRRLSAEFRNFRDKTKIFQQDPDTGDYPLLRLMTQFCVEIFQRESEKDLEILPLFPCVPLAGGFYSPSYNIDGIGVENNKARAERKLFPAYKSIYRAVIPRLFLTKSNIPKASTCFVKPNTEPSLVHFTLSAPPTTWEALIQQNTLIPGSGPILPHHITRDLTSFEG
jgi:hypothetical protein